MKQSAISQGFGCRIDRRSPFADTSITGLLRYAVEVFDFVSWYQLIIPENFRWTSSTKLVWFRRSNCRSAEFAMLPSKFFEWRSVVSGQGSNYFHMPRVLSSLFSSMQGAWNRRKIEGSQIIDHVDKSVYNSPRIVGMNSNSTQLKLAEDYHPIQICTEGESYNNSLQRS